MNDNPDMSYPRFVVVVDHKIHLETYDERTAAEAHVARLVAVGVVATVLDRSQQNRSKQDPEEERR